MVVIPVVPEAQAETQVLLEEMAVSPAVTEAANPAAAETPAVVTAGKTAAGGRGDDSSAAQARFECMHVHAFKPLSGERCPVYPVLCMPAATPVIDSSMASYHGLAVPSSPCFSFSHSAMRAT